MTTNATELGAASATIDIDAAYREANIQPVLDELSTELVGLGPVKTRIREIAALLLVGLMAYGVSPGWAALIGGMATLSLRLGAIRFRWRLPVFRARV